MTAAADNIKLSKFYDKVDQILWPISTSFFPQAFVEHPPHVKCTYRTVHKTESLLSGNSHSRGDT